MKIGKRIRKAVALVMTWMLLFGMLPTDAMTQNVMADEIDAATVDVSEGEDAQEESSVSADETDVADDEVTSDETDPAAEEEEAESDEDLSEPATDEGQEASEEDLDVENQSAESLSGAGTEADPYRIANGDDWGIFAGKISEGDEDYVSAYYILTGNIGSQESPIDYSIGVYDGSDASLMKPFKGHLDGNNKTLYIVMEDRANMGTAPFRVVQGASFKDLTVAGNLTGTKHTGGLIGFSLKDEGGKATIVERCRIRANLKDPTRVDERYLSGIIANGTDSKVYIKDCVFSGNIDVSGGYVGGFLGWCTEGCDVTIKNCYYLGESVGTPSYFNGVALRYYRAEVTTDISDVYSVVEKPLRYTGDYLVNPVKIIAEKNGIYKTIHAADGTECYIPSTVNDLVISRDSLQTPFYATYTLKSSDGPVLEKGVNFTEAYPVSPTEANTQYSLVLTAVEPYEGSQTINFTTPSIEGEGTAQDPFLIRSASDWDTFADFINKGVNTDCYYKLMDDITTTTMVGKYNGDPALNRPFRGVFDGNGKTLHANLDYDRDSETTAAPFLSMENGTIKNLTVDGSSEGAGHSAGLVSVVTGKEGNLIENCNIKTYVHMRFSGWSVNARIGGVVGHATDSKLTIKNSVYSGKMENNQDYKGGFVGWCDSGMNLTMENCLFKGSYAGNTTKGFHPIAIRNNGAEVTSHIKGVYYTTGPNQIEDGCVIISGAQAYSEAPEEGLYSSYTAPDGSEWYVPAQICNLRPHYPYTGYEIDLNYTVETETGGRVLVEGTDYTAGITPSPVKDRGDYTLEISGQGICGGSVSASFYIGGSAGEGTEESPYLISSVTDWDDFASAVARGEDTDAWYKMTADIGNEQNPVTTIVGGASDQAFKGHFDGAGKKLYVAIDDEENAGTAPFRRVENATIKNLTVTGTVTGTTHTAGLIGYCKSGTLIDNCTIKAAVSVPATEGNRHMGGVVGHGLDSTFTIKDTVFSGTMYNTGSFAGGFMGWADCLGTITIENSFFIGSYIGTAQNSFHPIGIKDRGNNKYFYSKVNGAYHSVDSTLTYDQRFYRIGGGEEGTKIYAEAPSEGFYRKITAPDGTVWYESASISGVSERYQFTGSPISVEYQVKADDGAVLEKGTDYTETFSPETLQDRQDYILSVQGAGGNVGSTSETFFIGGLRGEGTEESPYLLENKADWGHFVRDINAGVNANAWYKMTADIGSAQDPVTDVAGIRSSSNANQNRPFKGNFDGNGKCLYVNLQDESNQGTAPFRLLENAAIRNLKVEGSVTGTTHAAGLVGFTNGTDGNLVDNCVVNTSVTVPGTGDSRHMGGVVGHALSSKLMIRNTVFGGTMSNTKDYAGGLLGWADSANVSIDKCIFKGKYTGTSGSGFHPILICGSRNDITAEASEAYFTQDATLEDKNHVSVAGSKVSKLALQDAIYYSVTAADHENYYAAVSFDTPIGYRYTGNEIEPDCTLARADGTELRAGIDYEVTVSPETIKEKGNYTLTVTAKGDYNGEIVRSIYVQEGVPTTKETTLWDNDAYGVTGEITIRDRIKVQGNVTLYLNEGSKLNALSGIEVPTGTSLTIDGTGELYAENFTGDAAIGTNARGGTSGEITINGGTIFATSDRPNGSSNVAGAAIGGGYRSNCGNLTINGGKVTADGDMFCACIGGGNEGGGVDGTITINGGVVNGNDSDNAWTGAGNAAVIGAGAGGNGGTIIIRGGQVTATSLKGNGIGASQKDGATAKVVLGWDDEDDFISATSIVATEYVLEKPFYYSSDGADAGAVTVENLPGKEAGYVLMPSIEALSLDGEGTADSPYLIRNSSDWRLFAKNINAGTDADAYYKLAQSFDTNSKAAVNIVGTQEHPFKGVFDGAENTLKVVIKDTENNGTAPFRYIEGATIKNLKVTGTVTGTTHTAGLVGFSKTGSTNVIEDCEIDMDVVVPASDGNRHLGGVVGHAASSTLTVKGTIFGGRLNNTGDYAGGIIGWAEDATVTLENCLYKGSLIGKECGKFHPLAIKSGSAEVNVSTDHLCYTDAPTLTDPDYIFADGFRVEASIPENRIYSIVEVAGRDCYQRATASGIYHYYHYTGSDILPDESMMASDGTELTKGVDYTTDITPGVMKEKGEYTHTITGKGNYHGEQVTSITVGEGYPILEDLTEWTSGTYHVIRDITFDSRVRVNGDVTLVLDGDYTVRAMKGISVNEGNKLTIEGTGNLVAEGWSEQGWSGWANGRNAGIGSDSGKHCGEIVINSGNISAKGGYAAGIGGGQNGNAGTITINGGKISPWSYQNGASIGGSGTGSGGLITLNGGQIEASGGSVGKGWSGTSGKIILNWTNEDDYYFFNNFSSNDIELKNMFHFYAYGRDIGPVTTAELKDKISAYIVIPYVIPGKDDAKLKIIGTQGTVHRGDEIRLSAVAEVPGENGVLTWKSDSPRVFSIDENTGEVTMHGYGEATITATYTSDTTAGEAAVTLELDPIFPEITWSADSFSYDGRAHAPTVQLGGIEQGDECYAVIQVKDGSDNIVEEPSAVGSYTIAILRLEGKDKDYYYVPYDKKKHTFTIDKADIAGAEVTLGEALTYNGSEQSQTVARVTLSGNDITQYCDISENKATNAGTYALKLAAKENSNYQGTVRKEFIVGRKPIDPIITVSENTADASGEWIYTGLPIEPGCIVTDGDTGATLEVTDYEVKAEDNINAGTGKLIVSAKDSGNYTFEPATTEFEIQKAAAPVLSDIRIKRSYATASLSVSAASRMPVDAGTLVYTADTEGIRIEKTDGSNAEVTSFNVTEDGDVTATVTGGCAGDEFLLPVKISSDNYQDATLRIYFKLLNKNDTQITLPGGNLLSKTYGEAAFIIDKTAAQPGENGVWSFTSSNPEVVAVEEDTGKVTIAGVGISVITVSYESDTTIGEAFITIGVKKASISPAVSLEDWTYGGEEKAAVITGNSGNGKVTLEYKKKGENDSAYTDEVPTKAGKYVIRATIAETANYKGGTATAEFEIKAAKTVIFRLPEASEITYGDTLDDSELTGGIVTSGRSQVPGTFSWCDPTKKPEVKDSETTEYEVIFIPEDTENYLTVKGKITLEVEKAEAVITKEPSERELVYKGKAQDLIVPGEIVGGRFNYYFYVEGEMEGPEDLGDKIPQGTQIGEYLVAAAPEPDDNHYLDNRKTRAFTFWISIDVNEVEDPVIELSGKSFYYTGQPIEPEVTVKDGDTVIPEDEYTVSYKNNVNIGTATVEIMDVEDGNYIVSGNTTFRILQKDSGKKDDSGADDRPENKQAPVNTVITTNGGAVKAKIISQKGEMPAVEFCGTTKKSTKKSKKYTVPTTVKYNGVTYQVTKVADNAFDGWSNVTSITIGKNVKSLGKNLFRKCGKLKTINIKTTGLTEKSIKKGAFKGVKGKVVIKVPKKKRKAYTKLFRKKGLSKKVKIK
ncbi:MAG: leucine-rich repeat protein [Lachnospiraceae bacterium]|nr:leucine-rich repeat protein [Lachnospiraceae bacterium]